MGATALANADLHVPHAGGCLARLGDAVALRARPAALARLACVALLLLFALFLSSASALSAEGPWRPQRSVEIIVWSGAGGGADSAARDIHRILQEKKLLDVPSIVVNKPGGSGLAGMVYMNQHAGDGHYVSMASATMVTNRLNGLSPFSCGHTTSLALIAHDYIVVFVKPDSPFKSAGDLFGRMLKEPGSLTGGSTSRGGTGHIALGQALRALKGDPKGVKLAIFKSGAEVATATMGGHIDYGVSVAPTVAGMVQNGQVRVLGVAAPKRLGGALQSAPTLREQGIDSISSNWRVVVGPKGMSAGQIRYWDNVFGRMVQTPEWRRELENSMQDFVYLDSRASAQYCEDQTQVMAATLASLGLGKSR